MPTYVYEVIEENGTAGERFEVDQPMSADPLTDSPYEWETSASCDYWFQDRWKMV